VLPLAKFALEAQAPRNLESRETHRSICLPDFPARWQATVRIRPQPQLFGHRSVSASHTFLTSSSGNGLLGDPRSVARRPFPDYDTEPVPIFPEKLRRHRWSLSSAPPCRISPETIIIARPADTSSLIGVVVSLMNLPIALSMSGWPETLFILVVVVLLFGAKKLPELARGLGQSLGEFKKARGASRGRS
jgi:TatA/E family protein of Tat protein translocase